MVVTVFEELNRFGTEIIAIIAGRALNLARAEALRVRGRGVPRVCGSLEMRCSNDRPRRRASKCLHASNVFSAALFGRLLSLGLS